MNKFTLKICWFEGRKERVTETEIPQDKSWEEVKKHLIEALKDAYKYNDLPLPEGLSESDLNGI